MTVSLVQVMNQSLIHPEPAHGHDRQLLEAYRCNGDREAMNTLLQQHAPGAYRLALRFAGNAADAEDIVQDAFLNCMAYARSYQGAGSVRSNI